MGAFLFYSAAATLVLALAGFLSDNFIWFGRW